MRTKKLVFLSLLTALALVISLIEQMFPVPIGIPGAKLGISNIVILTTLVVFGFKEAIIVAILKSILLMLITGSVTSFWYSFAGAICSSLGMGLAYRFLHPPFSLIGVSEIGAISHNLGQLTVAMIVFSNYKLYYYMPVLTLLGLATGFFVGLASNYLTKHLKKVIPNEEKGVTYDRKTRSADSEQRDSKAKKEENRENKAQTSKTEEKERSSAE